jgi:hypothetical protein
MTNGLAALIRHATRTKPQLLMSRRWLGKNAMNTEPDQPPETGELDVAMAPTWSAKSYVPEQDDRLAQLKRIVKQKHLPSLKRSVTTALTCQNAAIVLIEF